MLRKNRKKNRLTKLLIVIASIGVTAMGKQFLERYLGEGPPLLLFLPAVLFCSYLGGFWTGAASTFGSSLLSVYFFMLPVNSMRINSENDRFRLVVFVIVSLIVSYLFDRIHAHEFVLELKNEELLKTARALKESNAELERFAARASHDLQEPARVVSNFLELLESRSRSSLDPQSLQYLQFAKEGAGRMSLLVRDLLTYTRLESNEVPLSVVDCDAVMKNVLTNLSAMIEESGATVHCTSLPIVRSNPRMMEELLQNLVSNAIKYHGPRAPEVWVEAEAKNHTWVFRVRDKGVGIATESQSRIFEMFQRLHGQDIPGTGIGLATCKMIVEKLRGKIWLQSQPNEGATFFFSLPAEA